MVASAVSLFESQSDQVFPTLVEGVVTENSGTDLQIHCGQEYFVGRRAVSCLLMPFIGDRVLVSRTKDCNWILAVLERSLDQVRVISCDGDVEIRSGTGRVSIHSPVGVEVSSGGQIAIKAQRVSLTGHLVEQFFRKALVVGEQLDARLDSSSLVGSALHAVVDRCTRIAQYCVSRTEKLERVEAGEFDLRVEQSAFLRGQNLVIKGRDLAKVDGGQIHLG